MAPNKTQRKQKEKKKLVGIAKKNTSRRLFDYREEDLSQAIDDIRNKKRGIREACRFYGVPKTTVHDRLSGKVTNKKPKVGPNPVLGHAGEEKLKNWVLDMAKCGFPIYKKDLLESVSKIIRDSGVKNPFKDNMPGDTWYHAFLRRHPEISVREPEGINNARAAVSEHRIRCWFNDLRNHINSIDPSIIQDPDRIFNGDETGFSLCPKSGKVLGPKGFKNLYLIKKNNDKENITVLVVFTASGKVCPPLVIFPYVRPPKALVDSMPESWVLGRSESGWMRSDVFYEYVCNSFNTWVTQQGIKKPVILFIDGHKSHMTLSLSQFCDENGIILYALPANTTHILQPADVSVFRPLKQEWKKTIKTWLAREENVNQIITKINFCKILNETLSNVNLEEAIKNGFRKCGLYPLNEDAVDFTKCVKDTLQKKRNSNQKEKTRLTVKDYDAAKNVILSLKQKITEHNIDANLILGEIDQAKSEHLAKRRSNSKTPRHSASSTISNSILNEINVLTPPNINCDNPLDLPQGSEITDIPIAEVSVVDTPGNFNMDKPQTPLQPCGSYLDQNLSLILTAQITTDANLQHYAAEQSTDNISLLEPGSFISLSNISVTPLEEIEISNNNMLSFDDAFSKHLTFPEPPATKDKSIKGPRLPSAISSVLWRDHYKKKEEEKENLLKEKENKNKLRAEAKEKRLKEKLTKVPRKKKNVQKKKKALQCSQCTEDLVSDVEEEGEKNIGCDNCPRWYHLKCTIFKHYSYAEVAEKQYKCQFCE